MDRNNLALNALLPLLLAGSSVAFAGRIDVPADYTSLQQAINAASAGDEIVVAPGTYHGRFHVDKPIVIRSSGGAEATTLHGSGDGPVFFIESPSGSGATLTGFTITGGSGQNGGGLFLSGDVAVLECVVVANSAQNGGGAFIAGNPLLGNVRFYENSASAGGGICLAPGSAPLIDNCSFVRNTADVGGGVFINPGGAVETYAMLGAAFFEGNTAHEGGGLYASMSGFEVNDAQFRGNIAWADGGGIRLYEAPPSMLTNSTFSGNEADNRGGAVSLSAGSDLYVEACEFTDNRAEISGGGLYTCSASTLAIALSSLWNNQPGDIQGDWADLGENTFTAPPLCEADLAPPFGVLDMADLMAFINAFTSRNEAADLAHPTGVFDLGDIVRFITLYQSGCGR